MQMTVMIMRTLVWHETVNGSRSSKRNEAICHQRPVTDKCADKTHNGNTTRTRTKAAVESSDKRSATGGYAAQRSLSANQELI